MSSQKIGIRDTNDNELLEATETRVRVQYCVLNIQADKQSLCAETKQSLQRKFNVEKIVVLSSQKFE